MEVIYIVLPLALFFAAIFVGAFVWAVRRGQLDDLETPAIRVALEDVETAKAKESIEPEGSIEPKGSAESMEEAEPQESADLRESAELEDMEPEDRAEAKRLL